MSDRLYRKRNLGAFRGRLGERQNRRRLIRPVTERIGWRRTREFPHRGARPIAIGRFDETWCYVVRIESGVSAVTRIRKQERRSIFFIHDAGQLTMSDTGILLRLYRASSSRI